MTCGIYLLSCEQYVYVGMSMNIEKRWQKHYNQLKQSCHPNAGIQLLAEAHGVEAIRFSILQKAKPDELPGLEVEWLKMYEGLPDKKILNLTAGGLGGSLGRFVSEETRAKMSASHRGRPATKGRTGMPHSEETKQKMSSTHQGKPKSETHRNNLSLAVKEFFKTHTNPMTGRTHSAETRERIALAVRGKSHPQSEETRKKISLAHSRRKLNSLPEDD